MKIAFLHLKLSRGPVADNAVKIADNLRRAARAGAGWVVTPETALQGYFFALNDAHFERNLVPNYKIDDMLALSRELGVLTFLCCGEYNPATGKSYNSCLAISPAGEIVGRQYKMTGHDVGAEAWSQKGSTLAAFYYERQKIGILICSDSWYDKNAEAAKAQAVDLVIVPAAWQDFDCGGGLPEKAWQRCSLISGAPVWVCNQTGKTPTMDLGTAKSAVVVNGMTRLAYNGKEAILLFEWDEAAGKLLSESFEVLPLA
ncbi:MAG: carbon-nitrogen hydrolase family protein [Acholeplasmataceae bacterium]|nr:carbon-nitrogen hydrolase family protein [Acidaminococcaceae bacterium]NLY84051.1 carbon-nitrogen hydrolase family protein [Acholeplasmataceae bacterium]